MSEVSAALTISPLRRLKGLVTVWPVFILWMLGIAFTRVWLVAHEAAMPVVQLSGWLCLTLLATAWMLAVGPARARYLGVIVLAFVGSGAGLLLSQTAISTWLLKLGNNILRAQVTDRYVLVTGMLIVIGLVALFWFGLAMLNGNPCWPRGGLLLPMVVGGAVIVFMNGAGRNLLPSLVLLGVGVAFGRWILRQVVGEGDAAGPLSWLISLCLGMGGMALVWLALGVLHQLKPLPLILSALGLLALARHDARDLLRSVADFVRQLNRPFRLRSNAILIGLMVLLTFLGLMQLMAALAPDLGFDSVHTHLAVAARFAQQGSLEPGLESEGFYWHVPVQVIYAGLTAVLGPIAAKVFHFESGVLIAAGAGVLAFYITRSLISGVIATLLFFVSSLVWWLAGVGYVDLTITFYFLAAICALIRWIETRRMAWLVITGLCVGVAVPAKLTNAALAPILLIVIAAGEWRSPRRLIQSLVICGGVAGVVIAPWMIRSYVLSGNPVFPWFNQIFRSRLVEPVAVFAGVPFGIGTSASALLNLPWAVTFSPSKFVEVGEFGVQLLAFSPLLILLLVRRQRLSPTLVVAIAAAIFTLVWAFGLLQNLRYLLPALPLFAILLAVAYHTAATRWGPTVVAPVALVVLSFAAIANVMSSQSWWFNGISGSGLPYRVVMGRLSQDDYIATYLPGYRALRYLNDKYQGHAQIWGFQVNGRLYSEAPIYFQNDVHTPLPMRSALSDLERQSDAEKLYQGLRSLGFTHLFFNGARAEIASPQANQPIYLRTEFLDNFSRVEYADDGMTLYKLTSADTAGQAPREMLLNGAFETERGGTLAEWQPYKAPRWDRTGNMAHTGKAAVGVDGANNYLSGFQNVMSGHTYRFRTYARAGDADASVRFQIQFLSEQKQVLPGNPVTFTPTSAYQVYQMYATAPSEARYSRVLLMGVAPQKWTWIDDASLVDVTP